MHLRMRSQNLRFLDFDLEIERLALRNRRETRVRRAEMEDSNTQLEHMGLPHVANQHQRELPPVTVPDEEVLPYVENEHTLQDYTEKNTVCSKY